MRRKQKSHSRPSSNPKRCFCNSMYSSPKFNALMSSSKQFSREVICEQDRFFEELAQLKKLINSLKLENTRLKNRLARGERDLMHKDKEIKSLLGQVNAPFYNIKNLIHKNINKNNSPKKIVKTGLVINVKKQINNMQKENKTLKDGLENIKKNIKLTNIKELKTEIKEYSNECIRLREILEKKIHDKSDYDPLEIEKKIKEKDESIKKLQEEKIELENALEEVTKELQKLKEEIIKPVNDYNKIINEQLEEIGKLKNQIEEIKKKNQSKEQLKIVNLANKEKEYANKIRDLEMELIECKRSLKNFETEELKQNTVEIVNKETIHIIIIELTLNLILAKVEKKNLRDIFFKNCNDNEEVSIHELTRILKRAPSSLNDEGALYAARYIIEPRGKPKLKYNELLQSKVSTIWESISLLLGPLDYNIRYENTKKSLLTKLKDKFDEFYTSLENSGNKEGNITVIILERICKSMGLEFPARILT